MNGSANVTLNLANTYTGGTVLNGGILTIGADGALGTVGDITFNGGTLAYADSTAGKDVTEYDISSRVKVGDGGALNVSVLGADDTVTWAGLTAGVMNTTATTLTKTAPVRWPWPMRMHPWPSDGTERYACVHIRSHTGRQSQ